MSDVLIIDYGMGNLRSVANAFEAIGCRPTISSNPDELPAAARIVLPGVGAFVDGMSNLRAGGWVEPLAREVLERGTPFLGICLGMQLLATTGTEGKIYPGLNWIGGIVERIEASDPSIRVPHIGWNDVRFKHGTAMYDGLRDSEAFYFVHSYVLQPDESSIANATCDHGMDFCASVVSKNIWAVQFHPEKSQGPGLRLLRNFVDASTRQSAAHNGGGSVVSGTTG